MRSLVLDFDPQRVSAGGIGHPLVDAWLRSGAARLVPDATAPRARAGRVWLQIALRPPGPEAIQPAGRAAPDAGDYAR